MGGDRLLGSHLRGAGCPLWQPAQMQHWPMGGIFNGEAVVLLICFELLEPAPGCPREPGGGGQELPGSHSETIPLSPSVAPSCEVAGLREASSSSVRLSGWAWAAFEVGLCDLGCSYSLSEPPVPSLSDRKTLMSLHVLGTRGAL